MGTLNPIQAGLMNSNAYSDLSPAYATQGVTVNSGIIQISGSFAIALASLVMIAVIGPSDLEHHVPLIAFRIVFIVQSFYLAAAYWCFSRRNFKNAESPALT
jgi:4-amino-4-deoxy-L-arabinose transferase-like glycosyltransferase